MTELELTDLRRWAAEACGYVSSKLYPDVLMIGPRQNWYVREWRPDTNIAQAMEVLDAITAKLDAEWTLRFDAATASRPASYSCDIESVDVRAVGEHESSRCLAILLACRQACEASLPTLLDARGTLHLDKSSVDAIREMRDR